MDHPITLSAWKDDGRGSVAGVPQDQSERPEAPAPD
jgi:hypothetical protein